MEEGQVITDIQHINRQVIHALSAEELHHALCLITFRIEELIRRGKLDSAIALNRELTLALDRQLTRV